MPATNAARENIEKVIAEVRKGREGDYDISQVMSFAELMIEAVQTFLNTYDNAVYKEMREIGDYITKAKGDIKNLQANDLQENHIPEAGRELDEIVKSTEDATHTIMESAEKLMAIDTDKLESYQEQVNDQVMAIFEACSFQDITGQRISKIVHTLKYIEDRIAGFSEAFGIGSEEIVLSEEEAKYQQRQKDLILNGPAFAGEGTDQDGVDALLDVADISLKAPEEINTPACDDNGDNAPEKGTGKKDVAVKPSPKKQKTAAQKNEPQAPKPAQAPAEASDEKDGNSQEDIDALFD
jgi:chemotaxis protein CheZ